MAFQVSCIVGNSSGCRLSATIKKSVSCYRQTGDEFTHEIALRSLRPVYEIQVNVSNIKGVQRGFECLLDLVMVAIAEYMSKA